VIMRRFFVDSKNIIEETVYITGSDVRHIRDVLRMQIGDKIICVDGTGTGFTVSLTGISAKEVTGKIESREALSTEAPVKITLAQSVPKSDKMELIVRMCTELGVHEIIPVVSERVVVQGDLLKKTTRWQRIAEEAAKQSGRTIVPALRPAEKFMALVSRLDRWDAALLPWEICRENTITAFLGKKMPGSLILFIGPEGGYSHAEAETAKSKGAGLVTLGKRILRVETAAPAALTLIMNHFGEL